MPKLQYDVASDPVAPGTAPDRPPGTEADSHAALRRLAEICIEAHGIVDREGPAEIRRPLEALLGRIGRQLGGNLQDEDGIEDRVEQSR